MVRSYATTHFQAFTRYRVLADRTYEAEIENIIVLVLTHNADELRLHIASEIDPEPSRAHCDQMRWRDGRSGFQLTNQPSSCSFGPFSDNRAVLGRESAFSSPIRCIIYYLAPSCHADLQQANGALKVDYVFGLKK